MSEDVCLYIVIADTASYVQKKLKQFGILNF